MQRSRTFQKVKARHKPTSRRPNPNPPSAGEMPSFSFSVFFKALLASICASKLKENQIINIFFKKKISFLTFFHVEINTIDKPRAILHNGNEFT
jgi:hypothetical protein